jgi:AbiV family abortive infection protein
MPPAAEVLAESIAATMANGKKLLEEAKYLFAWNRFSTALALAVFAQEEFAEPLLLRLVLDSAGAAAARNSRRPPHPTIPRSTPSAPA